jgi:hypothetical protein
VTAVLRLIPKEAFADSFQKLYERCQQWVVKDVDYLKANKVNLFVFFFWYHSPNVLDTPRIFQILSVELSRKKLRFLELWKYTYHEKSQNPEESNIAENASELA